MTKMRLMLLTGIFYGVFGGFIGLQHTVCSQPVEKVHIVVLGSSTAAGFGPSHPDSAWVNRYRAFLQNYDPQHQVTNLARGGYTTYHVLPTGTHTSSIRPDPDPERNITRALSLEPDAIIINLPSNDAALGYTAEEQLKNYEIVLAEADTQGIPVWIATTQPRNLSDYGRENLIEIRDSTFARFGDKAIDFWTGLGQEDGRLIGAFGSGDGVHLNNRGHRVLFERVTGANIHGAFGVSVIDEQPPSRQPIKHSVYPNPFKETVTIEATLSKPQPLILQVYDLLGRNVYTNRNALQPARIHRLHFDAQGWSEGLYVYQLTTAAYTVSGVLFRVK